MRVKRKMRLGGGRFQYVILARAGIFAVTAEKTVLFVFCLRYFVVPKQERHEFAMSQCYQEGSKR